MVPRRITYHKHPRQIRTNPYQDGSAGEPDQTLKKSKEANRRESFQDKGVIGPIKVVLIIQNTSRMINLY